MAILPPYAYTCTKVAGLLRLLTPSVARIILIVIGLLAIGAYWQLRYLEFDTQFENFFPADDPDLEFYEAYIAEFESDNDFLFLGIREPGGIFNQEFLTDVQALTDSLKRVPHIEAVVSPTNVHSPVFGPFGPIDVPYLHPDDPSRYADDSTRIFESGRLVGTVFSPDAKSVSLYLKCTSDMPKAKNDSVLYGIDEVLEDFDFNEVHVAGKTKGQWFFINKMRDEMRLFLVCSLVLLILFLALSFRTVSGVWVPVSVVVFTVLFLVALMALLGKPVNLMTTLLPSILFVVGISNVVHLFEKYLEELRLGQPKMVALRTAVKEIGTATFLTSLTTAIGFLTLWTSNIMPVQQFGIFTAIGVFMAYGLAFTMFPAVLVLIKKPSLAGKRATRKFWTRRLARLLRWLLPRRKAVLMGSLVVLGLSIVAVFQIRIDNFFLDDWSTDESYRRDYLFFEENFSGNRPFEVAIWSKDSSLQVFDMEFLVALDTIESHTRKLYGADFIFSPLDYIKTLNKAENGGKADEYRLPETERELKRLKKRMAYYQKKHISAFVSDDQYQARLSGKIDDFGGNRMMQLNEVFDSMICATVDTARIGFKNTGMGRLVDKNNRNLAQNVMRGLFLAFLAVAIIMGILFRSWRMVIIALLPNVLPLLMIGAMMGLTGINLKISTSVIFTIAFGIAVDDTIHFMSKLKIELNKGRTLPYALKRTYLSTGKAIVVTSIILVSGFLCFLLSAISSSFYIGLLLSIALLFAVISDLFFLPVLILLFYRHKPKKRD